MSELRTHIDHNGRMLIPAPLRKRFDIKAGDVFVVRAVEGEIRMVSLNKAVSEAQKLLREYIPADTSLVEELISSRKNDALSEQKKLSSAASKEKR